MQCDSPLVRPLTNRRAALHACYNSQTVGKRVTIRKRERERDSYATTIPSQSECIVPLRGSHAPVSLRSRYYFHTNKGICVKDKQMRILRSIESKLKKRKKIKHFVRVNNSAPKTCVTRVRKDRTSGNVTKTTLLEREGTTTG